MSDIAIRKVLFIADNTLKNSASLRNAIAAVKTELKNRNVTSVQCENYPDARPVLANDMDLDAILLATDMARDPASANGTAEIEALAARRQPGVPLFLLADRADTSEALSAELMSRADEFIWIFEDSPRFIAGRIEAAIERFRSHLLPPLMAEIWQYNEKNHEYSYAAPGHQGGRGFTKTPAGKKFYDFYGENLFRTDTGIERVSIGSLLDHSGKFGESEKLAAKVFGAHVSYSVVVGTSGSNRTVMQASLSPGDVAICDRNCHKSIEQGLILTGATPVYLLPTRNRYGIIGPILPGEFAPENIRQKISAVKTVSPLPDRLPYAVVTNCTYDGLCYNAAKVEPILEKSADRIHWDEAWYGYARFNPVYRDHYAMRGNQSGHRGATVFATHSTHKLLNALSQASYIHVRNGRGAVEFERMNQAYMMHATTSPLYAICASNDIAVKMMQEAGPALTGEVIEEAVDFRQALAKLYREYTGKGSWFFQPWNAAEVTCPESGKRFDFADAPRELLTKRQEPWRLVPGEKWHGFDGLADNYVMLDPIKVSILAPGMGEDGQLLDSGVPAQLVSSFLYREGIVPTRTTDFQLMFLFSMGITRGKWCTLLNALLKFKELYDCNAPVEEVLPALAENHPKQYGSTGIRDLGERMFRFIAEQRPGEMLDAAFAALPEMVLTPRDAYMQIVRNYVESVPSHELAGRVAANAVIPYPPGIPMMISGERFGGEDSPQQKYLHALEAWDKAFPGFEHETEGCTVKNGVYSMLCLKQ